MTANLPNPARRRLILAIGAVAMLPPAVRGVLATAEGFPLSLSEAQWRERLSEAEFRILRESGTERPGSSELLHEKRSGTYVCAGCEQGLFSSETKYDSGTGWPSFWAPLEGRVGTREDRSWLVLVRTEVYCTRCGGHLGHVFDDGPPPTGLRYCINGLALDFVPQAGEPS